LFDCMIMKSFFSLVAVLTLIYRISLAQDLVYTNNTHNYTVNYFKGWFLKEDGDQITIYAPIDGPQDKDFENINISVAPSNGKSLDELYRLYTKDLPKAFTDYRAVAEGEWKIDGARAKWLECTNKKGAKIMTNYLCLIVKDQRMFLFLGLASAARFPQYKEQFTAIMQSFKAR
jgi:hypothetical protein